MASRATTSISTKGQIVLPKSVREECGWRLGDKLSVEKRPDGVLLRRVEEEPHTRIEDVAGCLGPFPRAVSIEEMHSAIGEHVRKRWGHEYDDLD